MAFLLGVFIYLLCMLGTWIGVAKFNSSKIGYGKISNIVAWDRKGDHATSVRVALMPAIFWPITLVVAFFWAVGTGMHWLVVLVAFGGDESSRPNREKRGW